MPYIDTSVLTSYYWREERTERVQSHLDTLPDPVISPLVEIELHCAIARLVRTGECSRATAESIFRLFRSHLSAPRYRVVPLQAADYTRARDWIAQLSTALRVLDALHLAVSRRHGLMLVTADEGLSTAAEALGAECELLA
jgi:predicted nucleic acid-binding protein